MQPDDLVSVTEAAGRIGVNKSTVSRQVRDFGLEFTGGKFSLAAYNAAREQKLDPGQQRRAAPKGGSYHDYRAEFERTRSVRANIDLARLQGAVIDRKEIEAFLATALREFREAMLRRWRSLAGEISGLEPRALEAAGIEADEKLLAQLAVKLEEATVPEDAAASL